MAFTPSPSALDGTVDDPGEALAAAIDPVGDIAVVVGSSNPYQLVQKQIVRSNDAGATWTAPDNPFNDNEDSDPATDVCWSPALGLFLVTGTEGSYPNSTVRASALDGTNARPGAAWAVAIDPVGDIAVVVGEDGAATGQQKVVRSDDSGATWTAHSSPMDDDPSAPLLCVCWSPDLGLFLAGGYVSPVGTVVMTSPDGITWTAQTSPLDNPLGGASGCCWSPSLGLFLVTVFSSVAPESLMTSPDGITWTAQTSPLDNEDANDASWSESLGLFVAVGGTGPTNALITSPDGVAWTARTTPWVAPSSGGWSVTWCPVSGVFLAVSTIRFAPNFKLIRSTDGINWTHVTFPFMDIDGNARFAEKPDGTILSGRVLSGSSVGFSTDAGLSFEQNFIPVEPLDIANGGSFDSLYVGFSDNVLYPVGTIVTDDGPGPGKVVITSPDGITWTEQTTPLDDHYYSSACCWSPALGLFLVAASSFFSTTPESLMTSPDGITWTAQTSPLDQELCRDVGWSESLGLFVAVGGTGPTNSLITSPDGVVWTAQTTPWGLGFSEGRTVSWAPQAGIFLAVGFSDVPDPPNYPFGRDMLISSSDGVVWTQVTLDNIYVGTGTKFVERLDGTIIGTNLFSITDSSTGISLDGGNTFTWLYAPIAPWNLATGGSFETILVGSSPSFVNDPVIALGVADSSVIVDPATNITPTSATLNGRVNPQGVNSEASFDFGPTISYGLTTSPRLIGGGTDWVQVAAAVSGLSDISGYNFRVARDAAAAPPPPGSFGNLLPARIAESAGATTNVANLAQLQSAMSSVANGSTINITSSINAGGATWTITRNASIVGTITVTCNPGVLLTNFGQIDIRGSYLRFRGLDVGYATIDNIKIDVNSHDIEIDGCNIHNATGQGILVSQNAYNVQIWNNIIYNNGSNANLDHGIYFAWARGDCVIANNVFYDNWAYNVQLYPDCPNLIFTCNTVDGYTVQDNARGGVVVGSGAGLTNNIITVGLISTGAAYYGQGIHPYDPAGTDTNNNVYDSIAFNNAGGNFGTGGGLIYQNALEVDPLYVNAATHDYHLQGGSPAIDLCALRAGYVPPFDIEGNPRVTADAGAFAA